DPLQSVVGISSPTGSPTQTLRYGPFGTLLASSGTSSSTLRYTGREHDSLSGLYYYRARYYDPEIGRFLGEDPAGFGGGDVNLYAYVGNNPISANDPSGLDTQIQIGFTQVTPGVGLIPQTNHQFTILTDTVTGQQFALRGGPSVQGFLGSVGNSGLSASGGSLSASSGNVSSGGFGFGQIQVETGTFNEDFRDFVKGQPIQNVGIISRDFAESVANANEFRDVTNQNGIPYFPLGVNSNSVNTTFVESLTGTRPQSDILAPGNGFGSPSANLSYEPSSIVNHAYGK
ncbi:MAG TPA: RHS repeat-associated core domain-containing protein, partial [Myxococcota bacterium]